MAALFQTASSDVGPAVRPVHSAGRLPAAQLWASTGRLVGTQPGIACAGGAGIAGGWPGAGFLRDSLTMNNHPGRFRTTGFGTSRAARGADRAPGRAG